MMRPRLNLNTLTSFTHLSYFTIEGFRQVIGSEAENPGQARIALSRWAKAGHVIQLKRGCYMPRPFYEAHCNEPSFLSAISAIIKPQSYVSLESILQRYGILTEITYLFTSITTRHTRLVENRLGTFLYRRVSPSLYFGYSLHDFFGITFAEASLAKALFDYLYLRPLSVASRLSGFSLAEELRLNLEEIPEADRDEFAGFVEQSKIKKMEVLLEHMRKTVW
jgi:predicted transcriptional regulator of viral defense system